MAKIDYAYSLEIGEAIDAIQAQELYFDEILKDKRNFMCCDSNCGAKITCANMDKSYGEMKRIPHFKCIEDHSEQCQEVAPLKKGRKQSKQSDSEEQEITKQIMFGIERPENHYEKKSNVILGDKEKKDSDINGNGETNSNRKSNIFLVDSLVQYFIRGNTEKTLKSTKVIIKLGKKRNAYVYSLQSFFKEISSADIKKIKINNVYVYYGKARVKQNGQDGYIIEFADNFYDNDKKVVCYLKKEIIEECKLQRNTKENKVRNYLNSEINCYLLGNVVMGEKRIFINLKSLDHIAFSEKELESY